MATFTSDSLLTRALACIDDFYARMFRDWPNAVTLNGPARTLAYSGDRYLTGANHLWPYTLDALSNLALDEAEAFFARFDAAWSVVYADTHMPAATTRLAERDYFARWRSPLLTLDKPPVRLPRRSGVAIVRAADVRQLDEVQWVMSEAFSTGSAVNRRVVRPVHLADPHVIHYLLYVGDEPASCATAALYGGMAGIWNVGTRFRFRRQGCATTLMLDVLDDLAAQDCTESVLMASPSGRPLYDQLGYREIGTVVYMAPPPAAYPIHLDRV